MFIQYSFKTNPKINVEYDILTVFFLNKLYNTRFFDLKQKHKKSSMLYVSDTTQISSSLNYLHSK